MVCSKNSARWKNLKIEPGSQNYQVTVMHKTTPPTHTHTHTPRQNRVFELELLLCVVYDALTWSCMASKRQRTYTNTAINRQMWLWICNKRVRSTSGCQKLCNKEGGVRRGWVGQSFFRRWDKGTLCVTKRNKWGRGGVSSQGRKTSFVIGNLRKIALFDTFFKTRLKFCAEFDF
jgi:hypothetical protein